MPYYLEKSWERSHKYFPEGMNLGMINDVYRLSRYREFFKQHAKDKIVLDVGAGLGLIGLNALEQGAKHLYLVEQHPDTAKRLREVVQAHPHGHKATVIEGDFHGTTLAQFPSGAPELLVCELWGPHMWNEGLHATHSQAKKLFPQIQIHPASYRSFFNIVSVPWDETQIWPVEQLEGVSLREIYKKEYLGYLLDRSGIKHQSLTEPTLCFSLVNDQLVSSFEIKVNENYKDVFFHLQHEIMWPQFNEHYRSTYFYVPELQAGKTVRVSLDNLYLPLFDLI